MSEEVKPKPSGSSFRKFVDYCFYGLLTFFAYSINDNIKEMAKGLAVLTTGAAVHESRIESNTKSIVDHEARLRAQENGG